MTYSNSQINRRKTSLHKLCTDTPACLHGNGCISVYSLKNQYPKQSRQVLFSSSILICFNKRHLAVLCRLKHLSNMVWHRILKILKHRFHHATPAPAVSLMGFATLPLCECQRKPAGQRKRKSKRILAR